MNRPKLAVVAQEGKAPKLDVATQEGKAITALCAMVKCYETLQTSNKERARLAVFIVCPFRHLVEQWAEDVKRFGIKPIVGYGVSAQAVEFYRYLLGYLG